MAEGPQRATPQIHERNINVKVIDEGQPQVRVEASFLDLEHSFHARMVVDVESGRIEEAEAVMSKRPYKQLCLPALDNVSELKGQIIGPGIYRRISNLVGRRTGCVHLAEIFQAAVGFTATVLIGMRAGFEEDLGASEEEDYKRWLPILKNTCQVFRQD